jgi:MFS family permease
MSYKGNIKKLYLFKFLRSLHFFAGVLIPFFTVWGGISYFQVMLLQSWFVFWEMLLEIPTGAIADKFGRKFSVALGTFVNVLAVIMYAIKPNFYFFLAAEFLWALALALISGADDALVYDSLKEIRKEKESKGVIGRFHSFELIGIVVATPVGGIIAAKFGLQYATMAMAIPLLIAAFVALTVKEPHYKKEIKQQTYIEIMKKGVTYFLKNKTLRILAFDSVSFSILSFFIIWLYQLILMQFGLPLSYFGLVNSIAVVFEIIILNKFQALENILGSKRNYLFLSALVVGIGYCLLSISSNIIFSIVSIVFLFGFGLTRKSVFLNYMNKYIESEKRATVISTITMMDGLGRAIIYPLVGLLVQFSLNITLLVLGISVIIISMFSKVEEHMLID